MNTIVQRYLDQFKILERHNSTVQIDDLKIFVSGIAADCDGKVITGSAASLLADDAHNRTAFELVERIAIVSSSKSNNNENTDFKNSLSNGVAFHFDKEKATSSAYQELIERDCVLRSWYGQTKPELIENLPDNIHKLINKISSYDVKAYRFPNNGEKALCYGFFAFNNNYVHYGFGVGTNERDAMNSAFKEFIQRLAFLHNEEPEKELAFSPTPMYHQEYFMTPKGKEKIKRWLNGENVSNFSHFDDQNETIEFVDMTPSELKDNCYIIKAISNKRVPLIFGKNFPLGNGNIDQYYFPHPIA